jgi:hypothetical protein
MTKFYIDEAEIAPPLNITSLDQALKEIEGEHLAPNKVVRQIQVDGVPVMPDNVPQFSSEMLLNLEAREKVEIFTGTLVEIAHDSIEGALEYLDRIETATPSLASGFQISPGPESFESLRQLYEGLYWLNLLLDKLETSFHIKFENVQIQGASASEHHQKFISILKQMIDSHERGDYILIADLLEYEILPLVPIWREMFKFILARATKTQ